MKRVFIAFCLFVAMGVGADAQVSGCNGYACMTGPDYAECVSSARARRQDVASCQGMCNCMPDPTNGYLYCSCWCDMKYCYSA